MNTYGYRLHMHDILPLHPNWCSGSVVDVTPVTAFLRIPSHIAGTRCCAGDGARSRRAQHGWARSCTHMYTRCRGTAQPPGRSSRCQRCSRESPGAPDPHEQASALQRAPSRCASPDSLVCQSCSDTTCTGTMNVKNKIY